MIGPSIVAARLDVTESLAETAGRNRRRIASRIELKRPGETEAGNAGEQRCRFQCPALTIIMFTQVNAEAFQPTGRDVPALPTGPATV